MAAFQLGNELRSHSCISGSLESVAAIRVSCNNFLSNYPIPLSED